MCSHNPARKKDASRIAALRIKYIEELFFQGTSCKQTVAGIEHKVNLLFLFRRVNCKLKLDKYGRAKKDIEVIYHENKGRYGYRRITMELRRRGFILNHKTVQRLMKALGVVWPS